MNQKLAIFGGSFNPVHIGHLITAEFVLQEFNLNKIIFVPAYIPPNKLKIDRDYLVHRINMLKLALKNNKNFEYSDFEIENKKISYTIYTVQHFFKTQKGFLIIGDDWLEKFNKWYKYEKIFDYADLIVVRRVKEKILLPSFLKKYKNKIHFSNNPLIKLSSNLIRERIKNNLSVKYMVTEKVLDYIVKNNLYLK